MRLLVAIPVMDFMHFEFVSCLLRLLRRLDSEGVQYDVKIKGNTLVYAARNWLASQAVNNDYTHVLWLDADMIFDDNLFDALMEVDKPFVSAVYHARRPPFPSCVFTNLDPVVRPTEYPKDEFKIVACGFGAVLMRTDVLRRVFNEYQTCFTPEKSLGEDIAFCKRWTSLGGGIWCDPTIRCGHIGHNVVWPEDAERYMQTIHNPNGVKV